MDKEVYQYWNILEDSIKPMNDSNIVEYKNIIKHPNIIVENKILEVNPNIKS